MAKDLNQCNFIGRIGHELDLKFMPSGKAALNFSIGCNNDYRDKNTGEAVKQTDWVDLAAYGKRAETINQYCGKGSRIFVSGRLTKRKWQDKDGNDRYTTEIIVNELQMLDSRPNPAGETGGSGQRDPGAAPGAGSAASNQQGDGWDNDIPFNQLDWRTA